MPRTIREGLVACARVDPRTSGPARRGYAGVETTSSALRRRTGEGRTSPVHRGRACSATAVRHHCQRRPATDACGPSRRSARRPPRTVGAGRTGARSRRSRGCPSAAASPSGCGRRASRPGRGRGQLQDRAAPARPDTAPRPGTPAGRAQARGCCRRAAATAPHLTSATSTGGSAVPGGCAGAPADRCDLADAAFSRNGHARSPRYGGHAGSRRSASVGARLHDVPRRARPRRGRTRTAGTPAPPAACCA